MKLVRFTEKNSTEVCIGIIDDRGIVRKLDKQYDDNGIFRFEQLKEITGNAIDNHAPVTTEIVFLPPVTKIGKIIGVGLNYKAHALECNLSIPTEPTLFLKAGSALANPNTQLERPRGSLSLDWEVELGIVIGHGGRYIPEEHAIQHVAGYVLGIDFSERDFQFHRGGQGFKGKSCDGFGPLGPVLVTTDELTDPQNIELTLSVNGEVRQSGNTSDMIFTVSELVSYISAFMSLQPGDVILSGTPAGVGMGMQPPAYLKDGDIVEAQSPLLGKQTHIVIA